MYLTINKNVDAMISSDILNISSLHDTCSVKTHGQEVPLRTEVYNDLCNEFQ